MFAKVSSSLTFVVVVVVVLLLGVGATNALDQTRGGSNAPLLERFKIDLDVPPEQRWVEVATKFNSSIQSIMSEVYSVIPDSIRAELLAKLDVIGSDVAYYMGDYGLEISGVASVTKVPAGQVTLMNLMYELSAACTSIVGLSSDGTMMHGRNLDFGFGKTFTSSLQLDALTVDFVHNGAPVYSGVTYAGYVGLLTGRAHSKFSISVDEVSPDSPFDVLLNVVDAILKRDAAVVSFLIRDVLLHNATYADAVHTLTWAPLVADVFLIVGGVQPGEGVVLTRDRQGPKGARGVWRAHANGTWTSGSLFLVETNYDHWEPAPARDDRRDAAIAQMINVGQQGFDFDGAWQVLSTEPVLNRLTTYTSLMHVATGQFQDYRRHCGDDCPF